MKETSAREATPTTPAPKRGRKAAPIEALPAPVTGYHAFVSVQGRGSVVLPVVIRQRYGLDKPGAQVEITERADGVIELRPTIAVPASEAWFWEESWQEGERAVDADIAAGHTTAFDDAASFTAHLEALDKQ